MILTERTPAAARGLFTVPAGSSPAGTEMAGTEIPGTELAGTEMAGFVVWLAGQRVPLPQRCRVYREVEAFLAWQHTEFPDVVQEPRPAVWCYLLRRQHDGDGEAEVLKVWGALELLLTYLEVR